MSGQKQTKLIHLDTHVVYDLATGQTGRLSQQAKLLVENNPLAFSPMVELELNFLFEVGKIERSAAEIIHHLQTGIGLVVEHVDFATVVFEANKLAWTRDPFDRLIVAHAIASHAAAFITRDRKILEHIEWALA